MAIEPESDNRRTSAANWWKDHPTRVIGGSIATIITTIWALIQIHDHVENNHIAYQTKSDSYPLPVIQVKDVANTAHQITADPGSIGFQTDGKTDKSGVVNTDTITVTNVVTITNIIDGQMAGDTANNLAKTNDAPTNYLFIIENDTAYQVSYHLNALGKWGPAHLLQAHSTDNFNAYAQDLNIRFNPSLAWNSADQENAIDTFPVVGSSVTTDDWTNAPRYYFQINDRGQIDIFSCGCN